MTVTLVPVQEERIKAIEVRQNRLLVLANDLQITCAEDEKAAWDIVNQIGEMKKVITFDFKASKEASHKAWKAICDQEKGHLTRLEEPDRIVRGKLSAWEMEKRRVREEEERKAREAAEAAAAAERERLMEEARQVAEAQRLADAVALEASGTEEGKQAAEEMLSAPIEVEIPDVEVAPVVMEPVRKVEGAGAMVDVWKFEIVSEKDIPRQYLMVNETAIRKVVEALKDKADIPGVRIYKTTEARRSSRR